MDAITQATLSGLLVGTTKLVLYITCDVLDKTTGDKLGEITGPKDKLLNWAVEDYGPNIALRHQSN